MRQIRCLSYYLLCLLVLSSSKLFEVGLDIYETGHIHDDGSGQFEVAADLTKVEQLIKFASLFAEISPEVAQKNIKESLTELAKILENLSGISNVATTNDAGTLSVALSFQFNSVQVLNEAVCKLYAFIDHPGSTYFKMSRHSFSRADTPNLKQLISHYRDHVKTDTQIADLILKNFLHLITYHTTYHFDKKIKKATNKLSNISKDGKTIFLKQSLSDACEQDFSFGNKIFF
jgi:hypothetical protein